MVFYRRLRDDFVTVFYPVDKHGSPLKHLPPAWDIPDGAVERFPADVNLPLEPNSEPPPSPPPMLQQPLPAPPRSPTPPQSPPPPSSLPVTKAATKQIIPLENYIMALFQAAHTGRLGGGKVEWPRNCKGSASSFASPAPRLSLQH